MAAPLTPTVFVSHAHADKLVARRLVRSLKAYGVRVWLDEHELRPGEKLPSSLRAAIQEASEFLVVASHGSAASEWVKLEMGVAQKHRKRIVPFFIESVANHERFRNHLGVDATSPQAFADHFHGFIRDLLRSSNLDLPAPKPDVLAAGLRELAREQPDLAPLILGCLDGEGLALEDMNTAYNAAFYALDEALNALFDLRPNEAIAYHAASGFAQAGAGVRALSLWIAATGDGDLPLVSAVGHTSFGPALMGTAIQLLGRCDPPNNHALYMFIGKNATLLDPEQRRAVIRLVTWPARKDTRRLADVLAWVALKHFPDAVGIREMWCRWIRERTFDGQSSSPADLASYLADMDKEKLPDMESIYETLRSHVRGFLRSGDKEKVAAAVDHICAAADARAPVLSLLLREASGVVATAEWEDWLKRDPDTAEWWGWYVSAHVKEATGDRNWLRALESAEQMVAFQKLRRQRLGQIMDKDNQ